MNKQQFLNALEVKLCGLPSEDAQKTLDFYAEMIDDRIDDGLSEEDAVAAIGNIHDISNEILKDIPMPKLVKQAAKNSRALSAWEIVLLILGSPIWLSLIIAAIAVVLSVYVVLWSVIISLYAVFFSLAVCGIAGVFVFPVFAFMGNTVQGVFLIGCGLVCVGLAILMFMVSNLATKGILWLSRKIWFLIKRCFAKRMGGNEKV